MIRYPPAKINLGLAVTGRRANGYHDLETVFVQIPLTDILEIVPSKVHGVRLSTSGIEIPSGANLIEKAWGLVSEEFGIGAIDAHLHKRIPMGAGLGGGSSDGAFTLRMLKEMYHLPKSDFWHEAAVQLGADCAFFMQDESMSAHGIGDVLEKANITLSGLGLVLIYPNIHVSTAEAFKAIVPKTASFHPKDIETINPLTWKECLVNDFEVPVFRHHAVLKDIKEMLYQRGAIYAAMSGSGSTMFGLFEGTIPDFSSVYPSYFVFSNRF